MQVAAVDNERSEYRVLAQQVRDAGLLDRRPWYYAMKIGGTVAATAAGLAALFSVGNSPVVLAVAAVWAVTSTQVVFVGHDAGHQQIVRNRRANWLIGLGAGNLCTGLSFGWWVPKHNAHHAHPNQVDRDPDIGPGAIAFTKEMAGNRHGVGRLLARWQAGLFFPVLLLEGLHLHVAGIQALLKRRERAARVEALLLVVWAIGYLSVIFWVLSPLWALTFIAVHQGLFGLYLGCAFAPNHTGMPVIDQDSPMSFVHRQVLTARNVTGNGFTTFMLGGLNYQIEHHLFPAMPRPNLARAQTLVRAFCVDNDLPYAQVSLLGSYRQALRHLRQVGARPAQDRYASPTSATTSSIEPTIPVKNGPNSAKRVDASSNRMV